MGPSQASTGMDATKGAAAAAAAACDGAPAGPSRMGPPVAPPATTSLLRSGYVWRDPLGKWWHPAAGIYLNH
eukprot:15447146-Alexandrium_andersonii.AAC.1